MSDELRKEGLPWLMNESEARSALLSAISESEKVRQQALSGLTTMLGALDSGGLSQLLAVENTNYVHALQSLDDTRRAMVFDRSPALEYMVSVQRNIQDMATGLAESVIKAQVRWAADTVESFKAQTQMAAVCGHSFDLSPIQDLARLSSTLFEMQKVTAVSDLLISRLDWNALSPVYDVDSLMVSAVRDTFEGFSRTYDGLFRGLQTQARAETFRLPDLSRLTVLDYHNTVEVLGVLAPVADIPDVTEFRRNLREQQILEFGSDLERMLHELNPAFADAWRGAEVALQSGHTDHERHWSVSMRELLTHVLHALAPDDKIRIWTNSPQNFDEKGKPKRECRMRYICRGALSAGKTEFADFLEKDVGCFVGIMRMLQGGTHGMPPTLRSEDLRFVQAKIESMLVYLLRMAKETYE